LRLSDLLRREYFAPDWMPYSKLQIDWQGSSATLETDTETDAGPVTVTFYRIEVAREDVSSCCQRDMNRGFRRRCPLRHPQRNPTQAGRLENTVVNRS